MKIHDLALPLLLSASAIPVFSMAAAADITLAMHEQQNLPVAGTLERIAVADPEVADVLMVRGSGGKNGSVILVGKKAGVTTVTAWAKGMPANTWRVTVQGDLQAAVAGQGGADVKVRGAASVISGQAPSLLDHTKSSAAAVDAAGKGKVLDISTIDGGNVVQIDVKIVEFSKSILKEVGFDFGLLVNRGNFSFNLGSNLASNGGLTSASSAFGLLTKFSRGSYSLSSNLRLIEGNGMARVLAEPSLTALSGQSASFLAGGELPVPQSGGLGTTTIVYKPFGIGLTVSPTILAKNRIALKVAPEASDVDYTKVVVADGISVPSISTRRADTTVELGDGESFIIGGLVSRTTISNVKKIPLLGDLPIIGSFFRNMSYTQDDKELVIIVTPHIVQPIAKNVPLPLPGETEERRNTAGTAWGSYLLGGVSRDELPGFSK
ncbi:type II and III secretion system protein family protein [Collimonas fungivorans]|uniref:Type II/IV secretion system secretin, associated with Flp pilus assembly n=1 Tax=Collimonas fungivorans (strain Ter331) TaxID=1005048 RepID=G0AIA5_COLFT|nr:type II and III secretion system protein family protein [Collimonas fungivorans]AEK60688.1 Type II/IV secretion system secretin, associated with Flp pilus assembly [Collimonas fungivorans Ter331]